MNHRLHHFMQQLTDEMAGNYKEIQEWASTDPGTAGDQGEENWAKWLREWLPPTYQVVTKGQIINREGKASRQIDVLVLQPFYPKRLHSEKHYFSVGVAAAFECKTTLKTSHIDEAVGICADLKHLYPVRTGSPYKELHAPIAYGLLAHSHDWKGENSTPIDNIQQQLLNSTVSHVSHPRLGLDFLCVADLGTWGLMKLIFPYRRTNSDLPSQKTQDQVRCAHLPHIPVRDEEANDFTAIGSFYVNFMERLAWEDPTLRDIVDYYRVTGEGGSGSGEMPYQWDYSIFSEAVQNQIRGGRPGGNVLSWDEWKIGFGVRMQVHE